MATKPERTKVDITVSSTGELRTFNITLTAPACDFQLTDLLRQRGVIEPLETQLKQALKSATNEYLRTAETLISGLGTMSNGARRSGSAANDTGRSAPTHSAD